MGKEAILVIFWQCPEFDGSPGKRYTHLTGTTQNISALYTSIDCVKIWSGCVIYYSSNGKKIIRISGTASKRRNGGDWRTQGDEEEDRRELGREKEQDHHTEWQGEYRNLFLFYHTF